MSVIAANKPPFINLFMREIFKTFVKTGAKQINFEVFHVLFDDLTNNCSKLIKSINFTSILKTIHGKFYTFIDTDFTHRIFYDV